MRGMESAEFPRNTDERFLVYPDRLEWPHAAFKRYLRFSPLEQTHKLDGDLLTYLHHSMREGNPQRASHQLGSAWAQVELAHVRDFQGASAEAQELIALAETQASACERLVERRYKNRPEYFDRLYRAHLLCLYTKHFAQLGPTHWPEHPTNFQRNAYAEVQESIMNPLMDDFFEYRQPKDEDSKKSLSILKGLLGEVVVLQCLNRLQRTQQDLNWTVSPASMRENCRDATGRSGKELSTAFDIKCTFANQTFVPIEVKWNDPTKSERYDPSIAFISVNDQGLDAMDTALAMRREVDQQPLSRFDATCISTMTDAILRCISQVDYQGIDIYSSNLHSSNS